MSNSSFFTGSGITANQTSAIATSVSSAATSATLSASSATTASEKAAIATAKAIEAAASAAASEASKDASVAAKNAASSSASAASTQANNSANSSNSAGSQATASASSANTASGHASTATTKANEAAASAALANTKAGIATTAANSTSGSASAAASSAATANQAKLDALAAELEAENAEAVALNAASIATSKAQVASTAAITATTKANEASSNSGTATTKASEAASSATAAASSASSASASKDAALAALDNFDDRYLGQKSSDPTVDNDGDALVAGALYFNTTDSVMKVYEGSSWVAAYASVSGAAIRTNNLSDLASASAARTNLGLGTVATTAASAYATAAQGTKADAALPKAGGAVTGAITTNSTFDGVDIATRDAVLTSTTTTANAALPKTGGAMTGAITTNSTFDGVDIATRDAVLTSTTTTANASLPKAGGVMTGAITTNSTFDGRDVATDGTKLDTVETNADVTDTANVTSAGALMDSELTNIAAVKALNQGLATTDEVAFDNTSLNAIATDISDTAVDVFVYDTSRDSDGGAWRKRTQHTSWYNEAASSTRGSRKEFPSVAVIVSDSDDITTIYDGDDPDLPMWMVFNTGSSHWLGGTTSFSLAALNGTFAAGANGSNQRLRVINFIKDNVLDYATPSTGALRTGGGGVVDRNSQTSFGGITISSTVGIVDRTINDVAMTVLPNSPIDYATGLPVPTIAVATDGGTSIIRDDGTVVDIVSSTAAGGGYDPHHVSFDKDNRIIQVQAYDLTASYLNIFDEIPSADIGQGLNYAQSRDYNYYDTGLNITGRIASETFGDLAHTKDSVAIGYNKQLTLLNEVPDSQSNGMVAYITKDYSTGWMNGAIKLATLSDTDDTNATASGTNLLSGAWTNNGSFPYETFTHSGLNITSAINTTAYGAANRVWTPVAGKTYTASFTLTLNSGTAPTLFVESSSSHGNGQSYLPVNGANYFTFTATSSSSSYFNFSVNNGVATNFAVAGLTLIESGEADRSINSNPLTVYGTVTKTAVASGADLVGYSGFTTSNYLYQPYNADIDFAAADKFCIMLWFKITDNGTTQSLVSFGKTSTNTQERALFVNGGLYFVSSGAGSSGSIVRDVDDGNWHCGVVVGHGGANQSVYVDGRLDHNATLTLGNLPTDSSLFIGKRGNNSLPVTHGSLALLRISATAPSPEQIAKIYNDEKHLFQAGAQATLYGTSDAVTALAYDDTTDLLHAGTSAGRSVFQGLRRVSNTTDAVGAAISASNGLVAED